MVQIIPIQDSYFTKFVSDLVLFTAFLHILLLVTIQQEY